MIWCLSNSISYNILSFLVFRDRDLGLMLFALILCYSKEKEQIFHLLFILLRMGWDWESPIVLDFPTDLCWQKTTIEDICPNLVHRATNKLRHLANRSKSHFHLDV